MILVRNMLRQECEEKCLEEEEKCLEKDEKCLEEERVILYIVKQSNTTQADVSTFTYIYVLTSTYVVLDGLIVYNIAFGIRDVKPSDRQDYYFS